MAEIAEAKEEPSDFQVKLEWAQKDFWRSCVTEVDKSVPSGRVQQYFTPPDPSRTGELDPVKFCVRDVLVFEPLRQFDPQIVNHYLCPKCSARVFFGKGGAPQVRNVLGRCDHFVLVFKRYHCDKCGLTFRNIDERVLSKLPDIVRNNFVRQIVIRSRSAMTVELKNHLYEVFKASGQRACARVLNKAYLGHFSMVQARFFELASVQDWQAKQALQLARKPTQTTEDIAQNDQFKIASEVVEARFKIKNGNGIPVDGIGKKKADGLAKTGERLASLSEEEKQNFINLAELSEGITTVYQVTKLKAEEMGPLETQIFLNSSLPFQKKKSNLDAMKKMAINWVDNSCIAIEREIHSKLQDLPETRRKFAIFQRKDIPSILSKGCVVVSEETNPSDEHDQLSRKPPPTFPKYSEAKGYTFEHMRIAQVCSEEEAERLMLSLATEQVSAEQLENGTGDSLAEREHLGPVESSLAFGINIVPPQGILEDMPDETQKKRLLAERVEKEKKKPKRIERCESKMIEIDEMMASTNMMPSVAEFGSCRALLSNQEKVVHSMFSAAKLMGTEQFTKRSSSWNGLDGICLRKLLGITERKSYGSTGPPKTGENIHVQTILRFLDTIQYEQSVSTSGKGPDIMEWSFKAPTDFNSPESIKETKRTLFHLVQRWGSKFGGLDSKFILSPYLQKDHWTLFAIYPSLQTIFHFDSRPKLKSIAIIEKAAQFEHRNLVNLERKLRSQGAPIGHFIDPSFKNWRVAPLPTIRQQDWADCGPIILLTAYRVVQGIRVCKDFEGYVRAVLRGHIAIKVWFYRDTDEMSGSCSEERETISSKLKKNTFPSPELEAQSPSP